MLKLLANLWSNKYAKFIILDSKFHFTCGESILHGNLVNGWNTLSLIVATNFQLKISILFFWIKFVQKWNSCSMEKNVSITIKFSLSTKFSSNKPL